MTRRNATRKLIGKIIFMVIVAVSGIALAASGNMSNPFNVVSRIGSMIGAGGTGTFSEGGRPEGAGPGRETGTPPEGGFERDNFGGGDGFGERGGEESTTIQWRSFGSVVFNLWFIAATTAFVIVIGWPVGFLFKLLRRRTSPALARA